MLIVFGSMVIAVLVIAWILHKLFGMSYGLTLVLLTIFIVVCSIVGEEKQAEDIKPAELTSSQWNSKTITDFAVGVCYQADKSMSELKDDGLAVNTLSIMNRVASRYSDGYLEELSQESGMRQLSEIIEQDSKASDKDVKVTEKQIAKYDKTMKDSVRNFEKILFTIRAGAVQYRINNGTCYGFEKAAVKALVDNGLAQIE